MSRSFPWPPCCVAAWHPTAPSALAPGKISFLPGTICSNLSLSLVCEPQWGGDLVLFILMYILSVSVPQFLLDTPELKKWAIKIIAKGNGDGRKETSKRNSNLLWINFSMVRPVLASLGGPWIQLLFRWRGKENCKEKNPTEFPQSGGNKGGRRISLFLSQSHRGFIVSLMFNCTYFVNIGWSLFYAIVEHLEEWF